MIYSFDINSDGRVEKSIKFLYSKTKGEVELQIYTFLSIKFLYSKPKERLSSKSTHFYQNSSNVNSIAKRQVRLQIMNE